MRLSEAVSDYFEASVRKRGLDLYLAGRARFKGNTKDGLFLFEVSDKERCPVLLDVDTDHDSPDVAASCNCKLSLLQPCDHVWAALLAVESHCNIRHFPHSGALEYLDYEIEDLYQDGDPLGLQWALESNGKAGPSGRSAGLLQPAKPAWLRLISDVRGTEARHSLDGEPGYPRGDELEPIYVLGEGGAQAQGRIELSLFHRAVTPTGRIGKLKKLSLTLNDILRLKTDLDRQVCLMLIGAGDAFSSYGFYGRYSFGSSSKWLLNDALCEVLLPLAFKTGRVCLKPEDPQNPEPLAWDDGPAWKLRLAIIADDSGRGRMEGRLQRENECRALGEVDWAFRAGYIVLNGRLARADWSGCYNWVSVLLDHGPVPLMKADRMRLVENLTNLEGCPPIDWPQDWGISEVADLLPRPELLLESQTHDSRYLEAQTQFHYDGMTVRAQERRTFLIDTKQGRQIRRHLDRERACLARLTELGCMTDKYSGGQKLLAKRLPEVVRTLLGEGWQVLAEKKPMRSAGALKVEVTSGIDWFDLNGKVTFGDQVMSLPEVLAAARKGQTIVQLSDGSLGMLPEEWLARFSPLLGLGHAEKDRFRFRKTQVTLVDALLAELPDASFDEVLAAARRELDAFTGIQPQAAPEGFGGTLRQYQEEGLAWMSFLRRLGWGGCLADDMGLGKTVQVLALLLAHKPQAQGPSLIVMPKSLVFNWLREARRFAPQLSILDYTGNERNALRGQIARTDLVLTTYGTLRRDMEHLQKQLFDYAILDEAQAVKNPSSLSAKCARLIRARHRLVMTGTPVENHLGDLWSLFEFLNPGMLGSTEKFKAFHTPARGNGSDQRLPVLHRMLRPFILRRKKEQVAPELPERNEQVIECIMPPKQAAIYAEMREYYRQSLLGRVEQDGLAKSKVYVLEALLRLRQVACHPGLIDAAKKKLESAKLESLLPMVEEMIGGGHKALVFSQFTSFLEIVRGELDSRRLAYEYLDGSTQDRQARVDRFQSDPDCRLFLISLKAGGTGLNLTAADYVFILDPWWNPAVEAQAIDRTHRIGQDKKVIAYRLIARDTVESKILQLQQTKRELAGAIITEANSLIRDLSREDLEVLLS